jgi:hypothetical protein
LGPAKTLSILRLDNCTILYCVGKMAPGSIGGELVPEGLFGGASHDSTESGLLFIVPQLGYRQGVIELVDQAIAEIEKGPAGIATLYMEAHEQTTFPHRRFRSAWTVGTRLLFHDSSLLNLRHFCNSPPLRRLKQ